MRDAQNRLAEARAEQLKQEAEVFIDVDKDDDDSDGQNNSNRWQRCSLQLSLLITPSSKLM